jgi:hypothetical protein
MISSFRPLVELVVSICLQLKYILNEIVQTVTLSDSSWCARVAEDGEEVSGEAKKMESKLNLRGPLATKDIIVQAAFNVPFHFSHIHMNFHRSLNIFFCQYLGQQLRRQPSLLRTKYQCQQ